MITDSSVNQEIETRRLDPSEIHPALVPEWEAEVLMTLEGILAQGE